MAFHRPETRIRDLYAKVMTIGDGERKREREYVIINMVFFITKLKLKTSNIQMSYKKHRMEHTNIYKLFQYINYVL